MTSLTRSYSKNFQSWWVFLLFFRFGTKKKSLITPWLSLRVLVFKSNLLLLLLFFFFEWIGFLKRVLLSIIGTKFFVFTFLVVNLKIELFSKTSISISLRDVVRPYDEISSIFHSHTNFRVFEFQISTIKETTDSEKKILGSFIIQRIVDFKVFY